MRAGPLWGGVIAALMLSAFGAICPAQAQARIAYSDRLGVDVVASRVKWCARQVDMRMRLRAGSVLVTDLEARRLFAERLAAQAELGCARLEQARVLVEDATGRALAEITLARSVEGGALGVRASLPIAAASPAPAQPSPGPAPAQPRPVSRPALAGAATPENAAGLPRRPILLPGLGQTAPGGVVAGFGVESVGERLAVSDQMDWVIWAQSAAELARPDPAAGLARVANCLRGQQALDASALRSRVARARAGQKTGRIQFRAPVGARAGWGFGFYPFARAVALGNLAWQPACPLGPGLNVPRQYEVVFAEPNLLTRLTPVDLNGLDFLLAAAPQRQLTLDADIRVESVRLRAQAAVFVVRVTGVRILDPAGRRVLFDWDSAALNSLRVQSRLEDAGLAARRASHASTLRARLQASATDRITRLAIAFHPGASDAPRRLNPALAAAQAKLGKQVSPNYVLFQAVYAKDGLVQAVWPAGLVVAPPPGAVIRPGGWYLAHGLISADPRPRATRSQLLPARLDADWVYACAEARCAEGEDVSRLLSVYQARLAAGTLPEPAFPAGSQLAPGLPEAARNAGPTRAAPAGVADPARVARVGEPGFPTPTARSASAPEGRPTLPTSANPPIQPVAARPSGQGPQAGGERLDGQADQGAPAGEASGNP